jgi:hypothetical protein
MVNIDDDGWHYVLSFAISHKAWQENGYESMTEEQLVAALRKLSGKE